MTETIAAARNGERTVLVDGAAVHSRYDPSAEALRFARECRLPPGTSTVILVEPGLEYLVPALRELHPEVRVLCVHSSSSFRGGEVSTLSGEARYYPGDGEDLEAFLDRWIDDFDAASTKVLQWRPGVASYGQGALDLLESVSSYLRRAAANARTTAAFGRRWVRNVLGFLRNLEQVQEATRGDCPVILAAAGPNLETAIPAIRKAKEGGDCYLASVSSAAAALLAEGLTPDLVLWTDGGSWATYHLLDPLRGEVGLATSFAAVHPSTVYGRPILVLRDQSRLQAVASEALGVEVPAFPQRGTVAATALDLALWLSSGPVYLAGFDLSVAALRSHARPNGLDRFVEDRAGRTRPAEGGHYARYLAARDGQALRVYADWFARRLGAAGDRVSMLGRPNPLFPGTRAVKTIRGGGGTALPRLLPRRIPKEEAPLRWVHRRVSALLDAEMHDRPPGALPAAGGLWRELACQLVPEAFEEALRGDRRGAELAEDRVSALDGELRRIFSETARGGT